VFLWQVTQVLGQATAQHQQTSSQPQLVANGAGDDDDVGGGTGGTATQAPSGAEAVLCVDVHPSQPLMASTGHQKEGLIKLWTRDAQACDSLSPMH
jgi:hypothetical protein